MLVQFALALTLGLSTGQDPDPTVLDGITVDAPASQTRALRFIDRVAAPPTGRRLARWERSLCVSVAGLDPTYARFLIDRVNAVGASVGLDPGRPGCQPHVLIIVTGDPDAAAARLIREDLDTFRPTRYGATDRGAAALIRFSVSDAPVRWWHVSSPVSVLTGELALATAEGPAVMNAPNASRLGANTREALQRAVIIVDAGRIGEVSFGALGEYLAVVALAQIQPEADLSGYPTVLNLFSGPRGQRLTSWDEAYLQALYGARGDRFRYRQQASEIAERMAERETRTGADAVSGESAN